MLLKNKKKNIDIFHEINPVLGLLAMVITQDILLKIFFKEKKINSNKFSIPIITLIGILFFGIRDGIEGEVGGELWL